ncbi:hypothetical protein Leryth_020636 [Lithospermum erythrorhizon]|nr:hypothetical protein Leryth_020636 [Lithospermum erythrorhizon]
MGTLCRFAARGLIQKWLLLILILKRNCPDVELGLYFSRVDLEESRRLKEKEVQRMHQQQVNKMKQQNLSGSKLPVRRSTEKRGRPRKTTVSAGVGVGIGGSGGGSSGVARVPNFWTSCPYCYYLYEYPRRYSGCCLICQNCEKTFTADPVVSMPDMVPGKEEYYCCWGMFPMGFSDDKLGRGKSVPKGFANWMPPMQPMQSSAAAVGYSVGAGGGVKPIPKATPVTTVTPGSGKRRGRPRNGSLAVVIRLDSRQLFKSEMDVDTTLSFSLIDRFDT